MAIHTLNTTEIEEIAGGPLPFVVAVFWAGVKAGAAVSTAGAVKTGVTIGVAGATAALAAEIISED